MLTPWILILACRDLGVVKRVTRLHLVLVLNWTGVSLTNLVELKVVSPLQRHPYLWFLRVGRCTKGVCQGIRILRERLGVGLSWRMTLLVDNRGLPIEYELLLIGRFRLLNSYHFCRFSIRQSYHLIGGKMPLERGTFSWPMLVTFWV